MNNKQQERDNSLDYIKAFAICLVVMDHLIRKSGSPDHPALTFIYSLHMPMFFLVSGVLSAKKFETSNEILTFLLKKSKLILPIIIWGYGNVIILKHSILEFFIWHKFGLWFLWVLFLFFLIYAISQFILIKNKSKYIEIVGLLLPALFCVVLRKYQDTNIGGIFNFLNIYNYIFFILGVFVKRFGLLKYVISENISAILLFVYVIGLFSNIQCLNIPMKVSGVLFVLMLSTKLSNNNKSNIITNAITYIGKNSLYIYILHYYIILGIKPQSCYDIILSTPCYYLPFYLFLTFVVVIISLILSKILNINKFVGFILFGK